MFEDIQFSCILESLQCEYIVICKKQYIVYYVSAGN